MAQDQKFAITAMAGQPRQQQVAALRARYPLYSDILLLEKSFNTRANPIYSGFIPGRRVDQNQLLKDLHDPILPIFKIGL